MTLLKILLIQIRSDQSLLPAERKEFVHFSGLTEEQITTLDVFRDPDFEPQMVDDFNALMIGGLSDDDSNELELPATFSPFIENLNSLMLRAIDRRIPSLLSCGGFMLGSMLLGAKVVIDPEQSEVGIYEIALTESGRMDPLFEGFPLHFNAVSGHHKSTVDLPSNCVRLAFSERCDIHGFRVKDSPFYAFQFHPEITCANLQARIEAYKEKYFDTEEDYQAFIHMTHSTGTANSIISRFVQLVEKHVQSVS